MEEIRKLKKQLVLGIISFVITAIALTTTTYAWFVANNKVTAKTSTISATTNGFILQIAKLSDGVQHGGQQESLEAYTTGAVLSPASTDNLADWYTCQGWDEKGLITSYKKPDFLQEGDSVKPGTYREAGMDYHAYIRSDYIVYTITDTGKADVYLADDGEGEPIVVKAHTGDAHKSRRKNPCIVDDQTVSRIQVVYHIIKVLVLYRIIFSVQDHETGLTSLEEWILCYKLLWQIIVKVC